MNEEQANQVVEEEDFFNMDENDFADIPSEEERVQNEENIEENTTLKEEPQKDETTDEQKLLSLLKSKVRYNGEEVDIKSIDDVVANYQKGLNYDNLKAKSEKSENAVMNYVMAKAKSMNMTPEQYIDKVKSYEEEQKKNAQEQEIQRMMEHGVDEETARRVARTEAYMETLKAREEELNRQEEARKAEAQKDKEYQEFLKAYPGVEVDKIPPEVFENAKNSNLLSAYQAYENKQLKEKIKQLEQNQKNASTSVVKPVGEKTNEEGKDAFLMGLDSED